MERRRFLSAVVSVPLVGRWLVGGRQAALPAAQAPGPTAAPDAAAAVWAALDHASSWREAAVQLRAHAAAGGAGAEACGQIAALIDRDALDDPPGVLGLYPATVLAMASLRAIRLYGTAEEHRRQVEIVRRLVEAA